MSEYSSTTYFIRIIAKFLGFGGMVIFVLGYWIFDSFWLGAGIGAASYIIGIIILSVTDSPMKCPHCHSVNVEYISEIKKMEWHSKDMVGNATIAEKVLMENTKLT